MKRHMKHPRMDVNLEELDQIIDRGTHAPLSESEGEKLKRVLHALAGKLPAPRTTEKTKNVLEHTEPTAEKDSQPPSDKTPGNCASEPSPSPVAKTIARHTHACAPA